ncbi:hypothetical protein [Nocardioides sp.]|uniref:hypothetical protein n=1 Tax=Nocardioides sp. TaxID=35761 RepID=UPI003512C6C7
MTSRHPLRSALAVLALVVASAPVPATAAERETQTVGRVELTQIAVRDDTVQFQFLARDIGAEPSRFGSQNDVVVNISGCDFEGDGVANTVGLAEEIRSGTYLITVEAPASDLGPDWRIGIAVVHGGYEGWGTEIPRTDDRTAFTCATPHVGSVTLTYAEPPEYVSVSDWSRPHGRSEVGDRISVTAPSTEPGAAVAYEWYFGNYKLTDGPVLDLTSAFRGQVPIARVTVSQSGRLSRSRDVVFPRVGLRAVVVFSWSRLLDAARAGRTVRLSPTEAEGGASVSYRWQLDGATVGTGRSLALRPRWRGHTLSALVTVSKPDTRPVTRTVFAARVR